MKKILILLLVAAMAFGLFGCGASKEEAPTGLQVGQFMLNVGHSMGVCAGNTEISTVVWNIVPAATE